MQTSTGGGAATNAGIDYQQRLSALFLVSLLLDVELLLRVEGYVGLKPKEVAYETDQPIDDMRVRFEDESVIFFQAKRTIDLSRRPESEFYKVIDQFIDQYTSNLNLKNAYVLATSSAASSRIVHELNKILESMRLNDQNFSANPLTKNEQDTLQTYQTIVSDVYRDRMGCAISDEQFIDFSSRVFVRRVDVEADMPDERVALILLASRCKVKPQLVWSQLITNSLSYASARLSVNRDGLLHSFSEFLREAEPTSHPMAEDQFFSIVTKGESVYGREILIFRSEVEGYDFVVAEFARFDDDCSRLLRFAAPDKCIFQDGSVQTIIYRCAARGGAMRFLEENPKIFSGKTVAILERDDAAVIESTNCVQTHRELFETQIKQGASSMCCLH